VSSVKDLPQLPKNRIPNFRAHSDLDVLKLRLVACDWGAMRVLAPCYRFCETPPNPVQIGLSRIQSLLNVVLHITSL
jgi:hypothetical protein